MENALNLLGFAGSLRLGSYNKALLKAAAELVPPGARIDIFDLAPIPMYNADVDAQGDPDAVRSFKDAIREADALVIVTPEYNYGIPGVLKNAIDWASRPAGKSVLRGKAVAIMGASRGVIGTARAQEHLRQVLRSCGAYAVPLPDVLVGNAPERFDAELKLKDEKTREFVRLLLGELVTLAVKLKTQN